MLKLIFKLASEVSSSTSTDSESLARGSVGHTRGVALARQWDLEAFPWT